MAIFNYQNAETISSILGPAKHDFRQETMELTVKQAIGKNQGYLPILFFAFEGKCRISLRSVLHSYDELKGSTYMHLVLDTENFDARKEELANHLSMETIKKFPDAEYHILKTVSPTDLMRATNRDIQHEIIQSPDDKKSKKNVKPFAAITPGLLHRFIDTNAKTPLQMLESTLDYFRDTQVTRKKDGSVKNTFPAQARQIILFLLLAIHMQEDDERNIITVDEVENLDVESTREFHMKVSIILFYSYSNTIK